MRSRGTLRVAIASRVGPHFSIDVAFDAPPGVTILFGPSGAGKSRTLAALSGLVRPDRGTIALGDDVWFDSASGVHKPVHRRGVAMVFQSLALFPHLTARKNVEYGIDRRLSRAERKDHAMAMLERMRVAHLAERRPRSFSGGEAQRVALARAFAMTPALILLDEPFSAMDRELRKQLGLDLRRYVDEAQIPVVQVTHHRNEARAMGDRAVLIDSGKIVAHGPIEAMLFREDGEPPVSREARFERLDSDPRAARS